MVDVLVLAGAENGGSLQEVSEEEYEALIEIAGRPMVEYGPDAVSESRYADRVALIGPAESLEHKLGMEVDCFVEGGDSLLDNMRRGVLGLDTKGPVLLLSADIPLINAEAIDDFVEKARKKPGEVYYSLVEQTVCETSFPGMERTYVRLKEGKFTGGNLAMIESDIIVNCSEEMAKFFDYRKSAVRLGRLLGANILLRLALGRLKLAQVEKRVKKTTGYSGVGIISDFAEVAFDVDKPSDLELAHSYLEEKRRV